MTDRHERLLEEVMAYAESIGCKSGHPCAYHDILPVEEKNRMAVDYSPAGLAARLRSDRRIWHPSGACFMPVDAKTSAWDRQFPVEALQIGFHVMDNDGCLLAMRSYGKRECDKGVIITGANVHRFVLEIRIPDGFTRNGKQCNRSRIPAVVGFPNVQDDEDYYRGEFAKMFPGVPVYMVGHSKGSGDPFAVFDTGVFEALPDWREVVRDWALER